MKCFNCAKKEAIITVPSLQRKACGDCFSRIIEKRFKKTFRDFKLKKVKVSNNRPSDKILLHLLKKINGLNIIISDRPSIKQFTLDDLSVSILKSFLNNKNEVLKGTSPFGRISEQELIDYAKVNNLKFKGNQRKGEDKRVHELIMKLSQRRPGVMFSLCDFIKKLQ
ncbi:MAG: hypothetical protein WC307_03865 [Candidatus Nanoarchaeia archaeon]|jgi:hypothetical protein